MFALVRPGRKEKYKEVSDVDSFLSRIFSCIGDRSQQWKKECEQGSMDRWELGEREGDRPFYKFRGTESVEKRVCRIEEISIDIFWTLIFVKSLIGKKWPETDNCRSLPGEKKLAKRNICSSCKKETRSRSMDHPTEHLTILDPYNPSINVTQLHKFRQSSNFKAEKNVKSKVQSKDRHPG